MANERNLIAYQTNDGNSIESVDGNNGAIYVKQQGDIIIDSSTPIDVNITNNPVNVDITNSVELPVLINDSTPIDVNITNNPVNNNIVNDNLIVTVNRNLLDAGFALRTSQKTRILDIRHLKHINSEMVNQVGTGTATYSSTEKHVNMAVTSGQYLIRQTINRCYYLNGASQLIEISRSNMHLQANVLKRTGYYDSSTVAPYNTNYDGICFDADGINNNYYLRIYKNGSLLYEVDRNNWNDPLNGTGESGINIDFQLFNVLIIDFLWLGGTTVRFGFIIGNNIIWFHYINNSNVGTGIMMNTPHKPIRNEIRSTTGSGSMNHVCDTVITEGSVNDLGFKYGINNTYTGVQVGTAGVFYALLGMGLKSTYLDIPVLLEDINLLSTTNDNYIVQLRINPTVAKTFNYTNSYTNSAVQYAIGASNNTVTGGEIIYAKPVQQSYGTQIKPDNARRLGHNIDGTSNNIVLCVTPFTNTMTIMASINYKEFQ